VGRIFLLFRNLLSVLLVVILLTSCSSTQTNKNETVASNSKSNVEVPKDEKTLEKDYLAFYENAVQELAPALDGIRAVTFNTPSSKTDFHVFEGEAKPALNKLQNVINQVRNYEEPVPESFRTYHSNLLSAMKDYQWIIDHFISISENGNEEGKKKCDSIYSQSSDIIASDRYQLERHFLK
jgi:hypothetical protein